MAAKAPKTRLRKNDQVVVIAGKDKGKTGRILRIEADRGRVLVEGINMIKKAVRKKSQQDRGGIIEVEAPLSLSNVMAVTKDGKPSRIGFSESGGKRVRVLKKTGEQI
jgi:large subunit ribosomal protein L24